MADAFLHRRSIFDKHKDAYGLKNPIKQMRVVRSWDNPITRNKREKSLHDWANSFAGKRHYRKLSRHNALHLHEEVESLGIPAVYSGSTLTLADGSVVTGISPGIRGKCNVTINAVREGDFIRLIPDWDEQGNFFKREVHSKYELDYTNHGTKYDHSVAYLNDLGALAHHEAFHLCEEHMSYDIKDLRDKLCTYLKNEVEKVDLDYDVKKLEDSPYPSLAITSKPDDGHYYLGGYLVELKPSDVRFKYQYYGHPHEEVVIVGDDAQDLDVIAKYLFAQVEPKVAEDFSSIRHESKCEWLDPEGEAVLKKQAPKLIDALNAEFKRIGSPARLELAGTDVHFSDGYYLPVKCSGKWDEESRMLNARLDGKTLNGVKYYDGNIYLEKGWRPTSFRGARRMSLREKLEKMGSPKHEKADEIVFEPVVNFKPQQYAVYEIDDDGDELECIFSGTLGSAKKKLGDAIGSDPNKKFHVVAIAYTPRGQLADSEVVWSDLKQELVPVKSESAEEGITSRDVQAAARSAWSTSGATDFKLDIVRLGDHIIIYAKGPNGEDNIGISWHVHIPSILNSYETPHVEQFAVDPKGNWLKEPERTFDAKDLDELENQLVDEFEALQEAIDIGKEDNLN